MWLKSQTRKKAKLFQIWTRYVLHNSMKGSKLKYSLATKQTKAKPWSTYIHYYNNSDIDDYDSELKIEYNLSDVQKAPWIKNKKATSTQLLLTFKEKEPPRFIKIPRGQVKTKVYEYNEKLICCKTCVRYGHTVRGYRDKVPPCARCSNQGHNKDKSTSTEVRCCHCRADHQSFSLSSPIFKRET